MSLAREVADAYIEVHGDLSPFRDDLEKLSEGMRKTGLDAADKFAEAWEGRLTDQITGQWDSVMDAFFSGQSFDWDRAIGKFDSANLEEAGEKLKAFVDTMRDAGKFTDDTSDSYDNLMLTIDDVIAKKIRLRDATAALTQQQKEEAEATEDTIRYNQMWSDSMKDAFEEAVRDNEAWNRRRAQTMAEAIADNEKFNRSFDGIVKNMNKADLEGDFKRISDAIRKVDFSGFAKGFDSMADMRKRVMDVTNAMREQGRISREMSFEAVQAVNDYIDAEERRLKAIQDALDASRIAREHQEKYNKSLRGMTEAAKVQQLERDFRGLSDALASNDWSGIARGSRNMDELQDKMRRTLQSMRDLGRVSPLEFRRISGAITRAASNMGAYNLSFGRPISNARQHVRQWTILNRLIANAGRKFAGFSGLNVLTDVFRDGARFFQNIDRNAVKIGKMTTLLGSAAASMITILGGLAVAGQDLAAIGNIAILAPGFLTAAAIQAGVLHAAFKDMETVLGDLKPRFEKLQDIISQNFWKVAEQPIRNLVDALLPTLNTKLRNTSIMLGGLVGAFTAAFQNAATPERVSVMFDRMNSAIQIAQGAMAPLVQAFVTLGEVGSEYFGRFAEWIVEISTKFNNFIQAAAADGRLNAWIERALDGIKALWSIAGSLIGQWNAIADAAKKAGSGGLLEFAGAMERATKVMQSAEFQHTLTMLFSGAAIGAKQVGDAILALGGPIQSIMPTINLAFASIGNTMATVIGYIGQLMSNPAVQKGITDFTNGINEGVKALGPAIGPMGDSLGQIGTILGQVAGQVGTLITALVTNFSPTLDKITAAFARITFTAGPQIVSIMETIGPAFDALATTALPVLENAFNKLLPIVVDLINTLGPIAFGVIQALVPLFDTIVAALMPVVEAIINIVKTVAPVLIPAINKIVAALQPVIKVIGEVVTVLVNVLAPIITGLIIGAIDSVVGVVNGLSNVFMGVVEIITSLITGFGEFFTKIFKGDIGGAMDSLGKMFGDIWNSIVKVVGGALEAAWNFINLLFIGKLIGAVKGGLMFLVNFFKSMWTNIVNGVKTAMSNMGATIMAIMNGIKNFFVGAWNFLLNFIKTFWNGLVAVVRAYITMVFNIIKAILNGIRSFFVGVWNGLLTFIQGFWTGLVGFVKNGMNNAKTTISNIWTSIKTFFEGAWNGLKGIVSGAWTNIVSAVQTGITNVMNWVKGIPKRIQDGIGHVGTLLYNAGESIIKGFLDGLKKVWDEVTGFVGGIGEWIAKNKGPLDYDRKLLIPAGEAIMGGLHQAMMNKFGVVMDLVGGMADAIAGAFGDSKMYVAGKDAAAGLADGLLAGRSAVAAAYSNLGAMPALTANVGLSGTLGAEGVRRLTPPPPGKYMTIAEGAISITTPTKSPELVAAKVLDGFANFSNF